MAGTVKLKRSAVAGKVPTTTDLELGELALNTYDGTAYIKKNDGTESIVAIGLSADDQAKLDGFSTEGLSTTISTATTTTVTGSDVSVSGSDLNVMSITDAQSNSFSFNLTGPPGPNLFAFLEALDDACDNASVSNPFELTAVVDGTTHTYQVTGGGYPDYDYSSVTNSAAYSSEPITSLTIPGSTTYNVTITGSNNPIFDSTKAVTIDGTEYSSTYWTVSGSSASKTGLDADPGFTAGDTIVQTPNLYFDVNGHTNIQVAKASDYTLSSALSAVATSGSYNDLSNTPTLATVATSGSYNDLTNLPSTSSVGALASLTTGTNNTATGDNSLTSTTVGNANTAMGKDALYSNVNGGSSTAVGWQSLYFNTVGGNTAVGAQALYKNTTGIRNAAVGSFAVYNSTGSSNVGIGESALYTCTTGSQNTAMGSFALYNVTTGSGNIGIGPRTSSDAYSPVFDPTTENNRLVLGHTAITNAYVKVAWTVTSDARDKMNFAPVPYGLDFVNQLKPTAYQFKVDRDTETPNGGVLYGFKAQDILALEGDSPVIIDNEDPDNLKYRGEHLVPVLVNAIKELKAEIDDLKSQLS